MTDIEGFLTIYGHSDNLLNNNAAYWSDTWIPCGKCERESGRIQKFHI